MVRSAVEVHGAENEKKGGEPSAGSEMISEVQSGRSETAIMAQSEVLVLHDKSGRRVEECCGANETIEVELCGASGTREEELSATRGQVLLARRIFLGVHVSGSPSPLLVLPMRTSEKIRNVLFYSLDTSE